MSTSKVLETTPSETVAIDEVKPYFRNPRRIPQDAVDAVATSIQKYGYQQPLVVDKDYVLIVGHTRLQALKQLGWTEVEVYVTDLPEDKAREYRLVDNRTSEMSQWDHGALVLELREFEEDLLSQFFPDASLEISQVKDVATSQAEVEAGIKEAAQVNQPAPVLLLTVACPSCREDFEVRANTLPGVTQEDVEEALAARG